MLYNSYLLDDILLSTGKGIVIKYGTGQVNAGITIHVQPGELIIAELFLGSFALKEYEYFLSGRAQKFRFLRQSQ